MIADNRDVADIFGGYRPDGLYFYGPASMRCVLAVLIANSLLIVTGSSPDAERIARIRTKGNAMQERFTPDELREMEAERRRPRSGHPFYPRPLKPPTSGRRKAA